MLGVKVRAFKAWGAYILVAVMASSLSRSDTGDPYVVEQYSLYDNSTGPYNFVNGERLVAEVEVDWTNDNSEAAGEFYWEWLCKDSNDTVVDYGSGTVNVEASGSGHAEFEAVYFTNSSNQDNYFYMDIEAGSGDPVNLPAAALGWDFCDWYDET